jgi:hypothetical protein
MVLAFAKRKRNNIVTFPFSSSISYINSNQPLTPHPSLLENGKIEIKETLGI